MSAAHGNVPAPNDEHLGRGYGGGSVANDFAQGNPSDSSPLAQSLGQRSHFREDVDSYTADDSTPMKRASSTASTAVYNSTPSRNGTLKKKNSVRRTGSLKRSSSRRSLKAGSIKGMIFSDEKEDFNSVFHTPIPTSGTPTEALAERFQAWRQFLKSLITYFREIQSSYETRAKALHKLQNTVSNITTPAGFLSTQGLSEATKLLEDYHKRSISEASKSREIEDDVIGALTGLRSDLAQKIKEIKNLSGDFRNSVDKERDYTRKEVEKLQAALEGADHDGTSSGTGKNDPFVVRLGVDRAVEKQIDEENYLHRAYLNLESSGRELESIVVGEIQKAYKALAGILRREGDDAYQIVENLRSGPISMPKDQEWSQFVSNDTHFVSPDMPLRRIEDVSYPGKHHPAAAEIRAGMLERKSKYLKSYTAGWYVLSPTHLHEFKSADKIYTQPPVMSLYLGDQRLGSHSEAGSSSNKFMLKGRQAGGMHKGHNWVFRAESHDTMLAWFNDIKTLTEGTAGERSAFVRRHTRSASNASDRRKSFSSDGFDDDDADAVPYSADAASLAEQHPAEPKPQRPVPGGRFPSELSISRANAPVSPVSDDSGVEPVAAAAISSPIEAYKKSGADPYHLDGVPAGRSVSAFDTQPVSKQAAPVTLPSEPSSYVPAQPSTTAPPARATANNPDLVEAIPVAVTAGVAGGALGAEAFQHPRDNAKELQKQEAMEDGKADVAAVSVPAQEADTAKMVASAPNEPATPSFAAIPQQPSTTDPAAVLVPAPAPATTSTTAPAPVAETPIVPNPTLSSSRTSSTTAVKAAPLVSRPSEQLGGLESAGAHETGSLFPRVIRHDTNISVSKLHVPGEFPKRS